MRFERKVFTAGRACLLAVAVAFGLASGDRPASANDWEITVTPYAWLQGMTGDIKVRDVKVHVNDTFFDLLADTDTVLGGFLNASARRNGWGFYVEGNYSYTSVKTEIGRGRDLRERTYLTIIEGGGLYTLAEAKMPAGQDWRLEALAGVRYISFRLDLEADRFSFDRTKDWFDAFVGLQGHVALSPNWMLIGHADFGGLGIGSSSSFTTNLYTLIGYRHTLFGANVVSSLGYRGLYIDRREKDNSLDLWLHGPVLGMTFRF
jgi:hypothetical protein